MTLSYEQLLANGYGKVNFRKLGFEREPKYSVEVIGISPERIKVRIEIPYSATEMHTIQNGGALVRNEGEFFVKKPFYELKGLKAVLRYYNISSSVVKLESFKRVVEFRDTFYNSTLTRTLYGRKGTALYSGTCNGTLYAAEVEFFIKERKEIYKIQNLRIATDSELVAANCVESLIQQI